MVRHGHLELAPAVRISLLAMSAATIDRSLRDVRRHAGRSSRRKTPPSAAIRRSEPVRVRERRRLTESVSDMRKLLAFALLGLDTNNDSVFMNETVRDYCLAAGVEFTRCRPYRKNDQAWVEQKNGSVVRRAVGYRRLEGLEAAAVLARLYGAMRLLVNFFQPSFKLAAKARDGAKVTKRYHPPATPCERLMTDARTNEEVRRRLATQRSTLDPVRLLQAIRAAQQELVRLADTLVLGDATPPTAPTLEQFLSGLRTAWQEGEVRA